MASRPRTQADGEERDVTDWTPSALGRFIHAQLARRSVKSVEVLKRQGRVIAITWFIDFSLPASINVVSDGNGPH